jgi:hypothetical protein
MKPMPKGIHEVFQPMTFLPGMNAMKNPNGELTQNVIAALGRLRTALRAAVPVWKDPGDFYYEGQRAEFALTARRLRAEAAAMTTVASAVNETLDYLDAMTDYDAPATMIDLHACNRILRTYYEIVCGKKRIGQGQPSKRPRPRTPKPAVKMPRTNWGDRLGNSAWG